MKRNAERKVKEALDVLKALGLPREQQNERSALTLLSLLGLKPNDPWKGATNPLMGITPMMDFFAEQYGKQYAPNSRETVRRYTVHQFAQAGLVVANPDDPSRPTNSPKAVYQITSDALMLLRQTGQRAWKGQVAEYLRAHGTLAERYERRREMPRKPVKLSNGTRIDLSAGEHNALVKRIVDDFCPRYTPGGKVLYVGDTRKKWAYLDSVALSRLGVHVEEHGKMPDVVVHHSEKNWLVLIEAVTSHGPVSPKRRQELRELFADSKVGLVYITAFPDRRTLTRYLDQISWSTDVWVAESPTHLIHFNGERFLGPYQY